jgi:hypothetical protein
MPGHRLPSSIPVNVNVSEPDPGHDLALRVSRCRQSSYVSEVAINVRTHFIQFMMNGTMDGGLGQGCGTVRYISLRIGVLKLLGQYAGQSGRVSLFQGSCPDVLDFGQHVFILRLPPRTRLRIRQPTENQQPQPPCLFHVEPLGLCNTGLIIFPASKPSHIDRKKGHELGSDVLFGVGQGFVRLTIPFPLHQFTRTITLHVRLFSVRTHLRAKNREVGTKPDGTLENYGRRTPRRRI